jgi:pimeloyl-ACP methyl ester carboxylesterase
MDHGFERSTSGGAMRDIVTFTSGQWPLHGVLHEPGRVSQPRIGVVLLNENFNTKFGAHRLYRKLADALEERGYYALRFDGRGNCDSPGQSETTFDSRIADARAALGYVRDHCPVDAVVVWGLCMGAALGLFAATDPEPHREVDGLVLCNLLAYPPDATLPQFDYFKVDFYMVMRDLLFDGRFLHRVRSAPRMLHVYRRDVPRLAASLLRRYRRKEPELGRLRSAVGRVADLLAGYTGPCLLIWGEKDRYRQRFVEFVNPNDRLGLAKRDNPPGWFDVADGDHTFASAEQTATMIHVTLEWLDALRAKLAGHAKGNAPAAVELRG